MNEHIVQGLKAVDLETMADVDLAALTSLKVSKEQQEFGGTFPGSVEDWKRRSGSNTYGLAFFVEGQTPAGIVLLKRPPDSPDWTPPKAISLHGLKIAKALQGRGLGRSALQLSIEGAQARWPDATKLILAVDAGTVAALTLYQRFGMSDSGPIFKGRVGFEHRLELSLPTKAQAAVNGLGSSK